MARHNKRMQTDRSTRCASETVAYVRRSVSEHEKYLQGVRSNMRVFILLILSVCFITPSIYAQNTLLIASPGAPTAKVTEQILREAYKRIGIQIQIKEFPAERSLLMSNEGQSDGDVNRIKEVEKLYTNLIRVPIVVNTVEWVAFSNNVRFPVEGWESLKPYKIALRRGMKIAEIKTEGMSREVVTTDEQIFKLLDIGRVDVAVSDLLTGRIELKRLNLESIFKLEPPLTTVELYHYLHKKHENLVAKITESLQTMENEGEIRRIREQAEEELLVLR